MTLFKVKPIYHFNQHHSTIMLNHISLLFLTLWRNNVGVLTRKYEIRNSLYVLHFLIYIKMLNIYILTQFLITTEINFARHTILYYSTIEFEWGKCNFNNFILFIVLFFQFWFSIMTLKLHTFLWDDCLSIRSLLLYCFLFHFTKCDMWNCFYCLIFLFCSLNDLNCNCFYFLPYYKLYYF